MFKLEFRGSSYKYASISLCIRYVLLEGVSEPTGSEPNPLDYFGPSAPRSELGEVRDLPAGPIQQALHAPGSVHVPQLPRLGSKSMVVKHGQVQWPSRSQV